MTPQYRHMCQYSDVYILPLAFHVIDESLWCDPNRVADANVSEVAAFADPVHARRAHAEERGDFAHGE